MKTLIIAMAAIASHAAEPELCPKAEQVLNSMRLVGASQKTIDAAKPRLAAACKLEASAVTAEPAQPAQPAPAEPAPVLTAEKAPAVKSDAEINITTSIKLW